MGGQNELELAEPCEISVRQFFEIYECLPLDIISGIIPDKVLLYFLHLYIGL